MTAPDAFAETYRAGRAAFLSAAEAAGLSTVTRVHPTAVGRDGRPLFLDTVSIGRRDAPAALLVVAGTHGVEGYFGSAVLTGLLRRQAFAAGPDGVKVVLLHGLNPYGFAWDRRVDEANIDVNRNFVDFRRPPENPAFDAMAEILPLAGLSAADEASADAALAEAGARLGADILHRAIALGQYRHPDAPMFGGTGPSWSNAMLYDILKEELRYAERMVCVDLHTGLGAPGACAILSDEPPASLGLRRAKAVWPGIVSCQAEAVSPPTAGTLCQALSTRPGTVAAVVEIGTVALPEIFRLLRRDAWLHRHAGADHPQAEAVAAAMRAAFCPPDAGWRRQAVQGAEAAILTGLASLS